MTSYVQSSQNLFGIDTSEEVKGIAPHYVEVPVEWSPGEWGRASGRVWTVDSPLKMLAQTGKGGVDASLAPPYLALIIGPSGVGKTELIRQLCGFARSESDFEVLPISLLQCSWKEGPPTFPEHKSSQQDFQDFLFSALAAQEKIEAGPLFERRLIPDLHAGRVLLALDGLDEIVTTRQQHDSFFAALFETLRIQDYPKSAMRVLISCRVEYLRSLEVFSSAQITASLGETSKRPAVHFLRLDFFALSRIETYLRRRNQSAMFQDVLRSKDGGGAGGLLEIMERPLFLNLLCQLAEANPLTPATGVRTTVELMDRLVDEAVKTTPGRWWWDNNALSIAALKLFKQRRDSFQRDEIKQFVRQRPGYFDSKGSKEVDPFEAIHKCPLLRRDKDQLRFTHQVFFDYFVARAMAAEMRVGLTDTTETDFDRYVLSVETRRFLRDCILRQARGKEIWRSRTGQAYGLDESALQAWPDPVWAKSERARLDDLRFDLLEYMAGPSEEKALGAKRRIDEAMALDWRQLHPLYLIYVLEAISVYLWHYRWDSEGASLERQLETRLEIEMQSALRLLSGKNRTDDNAYRDALARLVSRILDIGQKFRLKPILKYTSRNAKLEAILKSISEPDTRDAVVSVQKRSLAGS